MEIPVKAYDFSLKVTDFSSYGALCHTLKSASGKNVPVIGDKDH